MRKIPFLYLVIPTIVLASTSETLYSGDPEFSKLSASVLANNLFANGPTRTVKQTNLFSYDPKTNQYYSHYQMNPVVTAGFKTKYWTREEVPQGNRFGREIATKEMAIVNGKGISYGGIFWPLELMTVQDKSGKQIYYNKIAITSMQPLSGSLFPLKVGNDLKFNFTRLHARTIRGKDYFYNERGIMEYKVIKESDTYTDSVNPVPGKIFTIDVLESTNLHPKYYLTDEYNFSEKLGWYITDKYYNTNNKLIATYRLHTWS